jgi:hypothetical protein
MIDEKTKCIVYFITSEMSSIGDDDMTSKEKVRKLSQAIRVLLGLEGVKVTVQEVSDAIRDGESELEIGELKELVLSRIPDDKKTSSGSSRRSAIESFITNHWKFIEHNDIIRSILFNAYCSGRYNKDQRKQAVDGLLSRINGDTTPAIQGRDNKDGSSYKDYRF